MRYQIGSFFETLKSMYNNNPTNIRLDEDVFRLQKTSSRRPAKTLWKRLQDVYQKRLQRIFKTCSRRVQDTFKTSY